MKRCWKGNQQEAKRIQKKIYRNRDIGNKNADFQDLGLRSNPKPGARAPHGVQAQPYIQKKASFKESWVAFPEYKTKNIDNKIKQNNNIPEVFEGGWQQRVSEYWCLCFVGCFECEVCFWLCFVFLVLRLLFEYLNFCCGLLLPFPMGGMHGWCQICTFWSMLHMFEVGGKCTCIGVDNVFWGVISVTCQHHPRWIQNSYGPPG